MSIQTSKSNIGDIMQEAEWAEELPANCPPIGAENPDNRWFYRLVNTFPPSASDFVSNRTLFPNKIFNIDECIVRALSIFETAIACREILKLPLHKDQLLVKLLLPDVSGLVLRTKKKHYSWWKRKSFNPIPMCKLVNDE